MRFLKKTWLSTIFIVLVACGPDVEDNPFSPCQSNAEGPPDELPPNLERLMAGFLNHSYWLFTNPQGDTLTLTADSTYTISRVENPACAGCENCPDMFELTKENIYFNYQAVNFTGFSSPLRGPFTFSIVMKDAESPAEIRTLGSDDMLWDIVEDKITDSDEIPEIWRFESRANFNNQEYSAVFYRDPFGKINFDRGYIWYLNAEIGPLALHDYGGRNINSAHDTLTLKAHY
jgi:hypothetical protein